MRSLSPALGPSRLPPLFLPDPQTLPYLSLALAQLTECSFIGVLAQGALASPLRAPLKPRCPVRTTRMAAARWSTSPSPRETTMSTSPSGGSPSQVGKEAGVTRKAGRRGGCGDLRRAEAGVRSCGCDSSPGHSQRPSSPVAPDPARVGLLPRFAVLDGCLGVSSHLPLLEELGLLKPDTVFSRLDFA